MILILYLLYSLSIRCGVTAGLEAHVCADLLTTQYS